MIRTEIKYRDILKSYDKGLPFAARGRRSFYFGSVKQKIGRWRIRFSIYFAVQILDKLIDIVIGLTSHFLADLEQ